MHLTTTFLNISTLIYADSKLLLFTTELLGKLIWKEGHIVNFISDSSEASYFIEQVLLLSNYQIVIPLIYDLPQRDRTLASKNPVNIIVASNYTHLLALFRRRSSNLFSFKAHATVIIFYDQLHGNFTEDWFNWAMGIQGTKIILVRGLLSRSNILVWYLNDRRIICSNVNSSIKYFATNFKFKWYPKFEDGVYPLTISGFHCPPFLYANGKEVYDGIDYLIINHVASKWPKNYLVYSGEAMQLYARVKTDVYKRLSDIAACSQWQTSLSKLLHVYDSSEPYLQLCITFLVPKPEPLPYVTYVFQPFAMRTWALLIGLTILLSIAWRLVALYNKDQAQFRILNDFATSCLSAIRVLTVGAIPDYALPKYRMIRVVFMTWTVVALIMSTAYSAGFTSILAKIRYAMPLNNMNDMVEQNVSWVATYEGSSTIFSGATMVDKMLARNFLLSNTTADQNEMISTGKYGVLVKKLSSKYLTDTELLNDYGKTSMKVLSDCAGEYAVVLVFQRNSPFTKIFNIEILRLREHGFISYWLRNKTRQYKLNYMKNFFNNMIMENTSTHAVPLVLERMIGAFALLIFCLFISSLVFCLEYVYNKRRQ